MISTIGVSYDKKIKYIKKVEFDKTSISDGVLITIIDLDEKINDLKILEFFEQKRILKKSILETFSKNNIDFQKEEFEDNETYFYIVSYLK